MNIFQVNSDPSQLKFLKIRPRIKVSVQRFTNNKEHSVSYKLNLENNELADWVAQIDDPRIVKYFAKSPIHEIT